MRKFQSNSYSSVRNNLKKKKTLLSLYLHTYKMHDYIDVTNKGRCVTAELKIPQCFCV